ncbi:hypothetical protein H0A61_00497 [Koleobacter methoxysyntrophicus]|uniref:Basic amino acid antiporter YfcC n=1 Tax=Koleobacter methoxysyntrophicus TaxID=2751313 RepID=A0A8A0RL25_9FIRM|nr:YfcC family protein [Koleobacter methoxysyntrophicus]QSQ08177.1 hypothetical protein H0A61_00497 [Koleobacter methoxysyntrophicus]
MKFKVPHTYVIIFTVVIVAALCTYIIPAGVYEKVKDPNTGRMVVDPDSFKYVEQTPVKLFDIFKAVPNGMKAAASIIFFIFIVGGAFGMIQGTGAVEAGIGKAVLGLQGKEKFLIPATMFIFSLGGATFGMAEETLVFIPIGVALARALGFDAITGTAMITMGAAAGFCGGFMNPFTVGVAQGIAQLPLFSGIGLRIAAYVVFLVIAMWYVYNYSMKVKRDPEKSYVADLEKENKESLKLDKIPEFNTRHKLAFLCIAVGFGFIIYGVFKLGWYITEIAALFLAMGIVAGLVGGSDVNKIARDFVEGAKSLTFGALVVGFARAILVVMEQGQIIDTVIHGLAAAISALPAAVSVLGMYVVQIIINFFIPSGSGQAATTMPIMAPLADLVGITRQTAVLAYQYGDGFTNSIIPTSAVLMGYLSIAKIPYERWVRWVAPLMAYWILAGAVFLMISVFINYGPF